MDRPVIFLSAVSAEFRELRQLLHDSFKTHFHVITQDDTLHQFPGGDVRQLLSDAIDGSHAVLHLAGAGFGSTAAAPFPEMPGFLCSWTQYEYYYAHSFDADPARRKQIFAIVCGPTLRSPTFTEKDDATLTAAQKAPLQEAHCQRIFSGKFDATPLASLPRTVNHGQPINDNAAALRAAIDICAQLATRQPAFQSACALVQVSLQDQLQPLLDAQLRIEKKQKRLLLLSLCTLALIGGGIFLLRQGQKKQDIVQKETAAQVMELGEFSGSIRETVETSSEDIRKVRQVLLDAGISPKSYGNTGGSADPAVFKTLDTDFESHLRIRLTGNSIPFFQENGPIRYRIWLREAERGNAKAQVLVGRSLETGTGVQKDAAKAREWYERAADQGNATALLNLGNLYSYAGEIEKNDVTAAKLISAAAELGEVRATSMLGENYRWGWASGELPKNPAKGLGLLKKGIAAGDTVAMIYAANLYEAGDIGVPIDTQEADSLYRRAAAAGNADAKGILAGRTLGAAYTAYVATDATSAAREKALVDARTVLKELKGQGAESMLKILANEQLKLSINQLNALESTDPMGKIHTNLIENTIAVFRTADRINKDLLLDDFCEVTADLTWGWTKAGEHSKVIGLWKDVFQACDLSKRTSGERDRMIVQIKACAISLYASGYRAEATEMVEQGFAITDAILKERPWDFYLKESARDLGFRAGASLFELGEDAMSQKYLRRGWELALRMFSREELLTKYSKLPMIGSAPFGAADADRDFFLSFENAGNSATILGEKKVGLGMKRFTIPVKFAKMSYPLHFYIPSGSRGYRELQDQFIWVTEYRGGEVPKDVQDSFRRLNKIALENNVDFSELCFAAHKPTAKEEEQKK